MVRPTAAKPLVTLGLISYSLYLWHVIIFWADPFPVLPLLNVLLAVIAAIVSYHLIEQPFRRRRSSCSPLRRAARVAPAEQCIGQPSNGCCNLVRATEAIHSRAERVGTKLAH